MPELEWVDSFQIQSQAIVGDPASYVLSQLDLLKEWNGISAGIANFGVLPNATIRGTAALNIPFGGFIVRTLSHQAVFTIGMRIKIACVSGVGGINSLYDLYNNGQILFSLRVREDGSILLFGENNQSKVIFDSGSAVVTAAQEGYLEVTVTISGTATLNIAATVWFDNVNLGTGNVNLSFGKSVLTSLTATFNRIQLNAGVTSVGSCSYSDFYIVKGTDRLGSSAFPYGVEIDAIFTISDSAPTDWTPTGGASHWDQINDNPPNDNATYVEASTHGVVDSYNWQTVPTFLGTIPSVFLKLLCHSTSEGLCQIRGNVGAGGTQEQTLPFALCDINFYQYQSFDTDPLTGVAWLPAAFNTRPFGIELV